MKHIILVNHKNLKMSVGVFITFIGLLTRRYIEETPNLVAEVNIRS
jgi:hypothetical protein